MDDSDSFEDCVEEQSINAVSPLEELKEWIKSQNKFPENIRKFVNIS